MGRISHQVATNTIYLHEDFCDLHTNEKEFLLEELSLPKDIDLPDFICISVKVKMKAWSDPGVCSGPPENCYPPEGEEEIVDTIVTIDFGHGEFEISANEVEFISEYAEEKALKTADWEDYDDYDGPDEDDND